MLSLNFDHENLKGLHLRELKVPSTFTVYDLKCNLYMKTGTQPEDMELYLCNDGNSKTRLSDDSCNLTDVGIKDQSNLYIRDKTEKTEGLLGDMQNVPKYRMPDDVYDSLPMNARKFIKQMRVKNPQKLNKEQKFDLESLRKHVGSRCEVQFPEPLRGEIIDVFLKKDSTEPEIIILLDKPKGVDIPECPPNYGWKIEASKIDELKIGDFPPLDEDDVDFI